MKFASPVLFFVRQISHYIVKLFSLDSFVTFAFLEDIVSKLITRKIHFNFVNAYFKIQITVWFPDCSVFSHILFSNCVSEVPNFCSNFRHFCAMSENQTHKSSEFRQVLISDKFWFQISSDCRLRDFRHLLYTFLRKSKKNPNISGL